MEEEDYECGYCEAEFKITHEHLNEVEYCPFCGSNINLDEEDEEDEDDDDLWDV